MCNNRCKQFLLFPLFFLFVSPVFAVTVTLSNIPNAISSDPFTINASIEGANPGTNYLRIDLYKEGTFNYFGETLNGSTWISGSDGTAYPQVTINTEGTGSAQLTGRIGNPSQTDYPGPGLYKIKVRRYTSSSYTFSNVYDLQISYALPTSTPTPIPANTSTPTSTPALTNTPTNSPTATKAPTPLLTKTPTPTLRSSPTKTGTPTPEATSAGEVLSLSDSESPVATPSGTLKPLIISFALIGAGLGMLSLLLIWQKRGQFLRSKGPNDIIS